MGGKKKKGGKKKGKKGKKGQKDPRDSVPEEIKSMDIASLKREIESWRQQLLDTKVSRNKFQNEKDIIKQFYEVTRKDLEDIKAQVMNKDTEMERLEENHRVEVKVYTQKIKHLEYDHQNSLGQLNIDSKETQKDETNHHIKSQNQMKLEKIELKKEIEEQELANIQKINKEIESYDKAMKNLERTYEEQLKDIENNYQQKLQTLKENLDLRLKVEIHEVEERKNKHRNNLKAKHEKAFRTIKDYYNDITKTNLEKIKELKDEKNKLENNQVENKDSIEELRKENEKLKKPLDEARAELAMLEDKLKDYHLDKVSLLNAKKRLKSLMNKLEQSKQDKRELETQYRQVLQEKDELYRRYESTIDRVRNKSEYKNIFLDQRLAALEDNLNRKEAQLQEVLNRVNLEPSYVVEINKKIEESLEAKNTVIKNLKYSLAHAIKAYNDAIRVYEAKLVEFGIPPEELGFQPIESETSTMPAGLVAA